MNYKTYRKSTDTPARLTRKQSRHEIFVTNKKMAKLKRKANRLKRKSPLVESYEE